MYTVCLKHLGRHRCKTPAPLSLYKKGAFTQVHVRLPARFLFPAAAVRPRAARPLAAVGSGYRAPRNILHFVIFHMKIPLKSAIAKIPAETFPPLLIYWHGYPQMTLFTSAAVHFRTKGLRRGCFSELPGRAYGFFRGFARAAGFSQRTGLFRQHAPIQAGFCLYVIFYRKCGFLSRNY